MNARNMGLLKLYCGLRSPYLKELFGHFIKFNYVKTEGEII